MSRTKSSKQLQNRSWDLDALLAAARTDAPDDLLSAEQRAFHPVLLRVGLARRSRGRIAQWPVAFALAAAGSFALSGATGPTGIGDSVVSTSTAPILEEAAPSRGKALPDPQQLNSQEPNTPETAGLTHVGGEPLLPSAPTVSSSRAPRTPPISKAESPPPEPRELDILDRASRALREKQYEKTFLELGRYRALFPSGRYQEEADVIAIEALGRSHRATEAAQHAHDFRSRYQNSPYEQRVRGALVQ